MHINQLLQNSIQVSPPGRGHLRQFELVFVIATTIIRSRFNRENEEKNNKNKWNLSKPYFFRSSDLKGVLLWDNLITWSTISKNGSIEDSCAAYLMQSSNWWAWHPKLWKIRGWINRSNKYYSGVVFIASNTFSIASESGGSLFASGFTSSSDTSSEVPASSRNPWMRRRIGEMIRGRLCTE